MRSLLTVLIAPGTTETGYGIGKLDGMWVALSSCCQREVCSIRDGVTCDGCGHYLTPIYYPNGNTPTTAMWIPDLSSSAIVTVTITWLKVWTGWKDIDIVLSD